MAHTVIGILALLVHTVAILVIEAVKHIGDDEHHLH